MNEYAQVMSTRLGLQALLTVLMRRADTLQFAIDAKTVALQMATETARHMPKTESAQEVADAVYREVEDLFRPVIALQTRDGL